MATYEMRLVIETDSDFSLNGKGANDKPYRVTLPTKKGETLRECYKRWLSTVKIGGHKKEAAKKWLSSVEVATVVVFGESTGNWDIKGYLFVQDLPETKHTCYECGLLVCEIDEMICEDCVAFEKEEGITYYEAMFNKPEGRA